MHVSLHHLRSCLLLHSQKKEGDLFYSFTAIWTFLTRKLFLMELSIQKGWISTKFTTITGDGVNLNLESLAGKWELLSKCHLKRNSKQIWGVLCVKYVKNKKKKTKHILISLPHFLRKIEHIARVSLDFTQTKFHS